MNFKLLKKLIASMSIVSIFFTFVYVYGQATDKMKDELNKQKESNRKSLAELKEKLKALETEVKEKNYSFKVALTEAMKYELEQLAGTRPPQLNMSSTNQNAIKRLKMESKRRKLKKKVKSDEYEILDESGYYEEEEELPEEFADLIDYSNDVDPNPPDNDGYIDTPTKPEKNTSKCSVDLPKWDWRSEGKVTPVKFQGGCGSCWAFTANAVVESAYAIANNKTIDLSEQQVLNCSKAGTCNGGWYEGAFSFMGMKSALVAGKNSGILENFEPYKGKDLRCSSFTPTTYQTLAWGYVGTSSKANVKEIKQALCKYGPLATAMYATPMFQAYKSGVFNEKIRLGANDVNHAVVIVGWDDKLNAYLIKNSWSAQWGQEGYIWMDYRANNVGYGTMWVVARKESAGK
ncbi:MAG: C1 family peptidase [Leptospiraceae bacterium]|nr:C1 family peptidase [Leptospiraceae bacterium]